MVRKKILMTATVPSMIGQFNINNLILLQKLGYEVEIACNLKDRSIWNEDRVLAFVQQMKDMHIAIHQIDFPRKPYDVKRLLHARKQMQQLFREKHYDGVHCHTPVAAMISRLVAHKWKAKVVYTAHGFHFFKGAPKLNWIVFFPMEQMLSRWTDVLITINQEDYLLAKKCFHAKSVEYVQGVGIDVDQFSNRNGERSSIRKSIGLNENEVALLSVGELSPRKNHVQILQAIADMKLPYVHYFIVGKGALQEQLTQTAEKLHIEKQLTFLGYRTDIPDLLHAADVFVFPSKQEGLPVALMEAIAAGVPCLASEIRGNVDLKDYGVEYFALDNQEILDEKLRKMVQNIHDGAGVLISKKGNLEDLDVHSIDKSMRRIYRVFDA